MIPWGGQLDSFRLPYMPFNLVDFNLYPSAIINHNPMYNSFQ